MFISGYPGNMSAYGYVPKDEDRHDMELLGDRFGVELPPNLRR